MSAPRESSPVTPHRVGDMPTLEAVYDQHVRFVWRALRALGVREAGVEDAVQDVFLVVHRRLAEFEGRSSMRTWLFGIAIRVASDERRRAQRDRRQDPLPDEPLADAARPTPFERIAMAESARLLARLLDLLEEDRRLIFVLAEVEEMTAPEIAEMLGLKLNTVYTRLRAAREQFERLLARHRVVHGGATEGPERPDGSAGPDAKNGRDR